MSSARTATLLSYAIEKNTRIQVLTCHRAHDVNDENWLPSLGTSVTSAHCSRSGCIFSYFRLYGADFIRVFCVRVLAAVITNNFVPIYTLLTEFLLGFRPTPRFLYVLSYGNTSGLHETYVLRTRSRFLKPLKRELAIGSLESHSSWKSVSLLGLLAKIKV